MSFLKKRIKIVTLLIVSIIFTYGTSFADSDIDFIYYEDMTQVTKTLDTLKDNDFSEYLLSASTNSYDDYHLAITTLFQIYRGNFEKLNTCIDNYEKTKDKHDSEWINGLINIAGREYVVDNEKSIINLIYNISTKNDRDSCIEKEKDLTFSEIEYFSVVKEFLTLYVNYVENLQAKHQEKFSDKKSFAKQVIKTLRNSPFQEMRSIGSVRKYLAVTNKIDLEPKVVEYILKNPVFQGSFDFVRTTEDLRSISLEK